MNPAGPNHCRENSQKVKQAFLKYLILCLLISFPAEADIIYFKDGLKTVCQHKAWVEGDQVKCEYEGSILIYQKADVKRIHEIPLAPEIEEDPPPKAEGGEESGPDDPASQPGSQDHSVASGVKFYDPRRTNKYWTSETSKHNSYHGAIAAFAEEFNRSPDWVEQRLGDTNDLIEIRRNLARGEDIIQPSPGKIESTDASGIEFYNPRRPYKYWAGQDAKFHNYKEALGALARQFECTPEWVEKNMGDTNDLGEIHQNLRNRKSKETGN